MLQNNFYYLSSFEPKELGINAVITFNPDHEIFEGHFPGKPVVPGVCMIQIVKELLQQATSKKLLFQKGHQIKFLQLLVPVQDEKVDVNINWKVIEDDVLQTTVDFKKDGIILLKLSGLFKPV